MTSPCKPSQPTSKLLYRSPTLYKSHRRFPKQEVDYFHPSRHWRPVVRARTRALDPYAQRNVPAAGAMGRSFAAGDADAAQAAIEAQLKQAMEQAKPAEEAKAAEPKTETPAEK